MPSQNQQNKNTEATVIWRCAHDLTIFTMIQRAD